MPTKPTRRTRDTETDDDADDDEADPHAKAKETFRSEVRAVLEDFFAEDDGEDEADDDREERAPKRKETHTHDRPRGRTGARRSTSGRPTGTPRTRTAPGFLSFLYDS